MVVRVVVCVVALPLREMVSRRRRTEEEAGNNRGGEISLAFVVLCACVFLFFPCRKVANEWHGAREKKKTLLINSNKKTHHIVHVSSARRPSNDWSWFGVNMFKQR